MSLSPRWSIAIAAGWLACLPCSAARGEEVSRTPPTLYTQQLSALLTPAEEVLNTAPIDSEAKEDGVILLDEEVHYFDESGSRYLALHRVRKANSDSGARMMAEDAYRYRKANQKIHLVLARTISADGKNLPLQPNAAILQTPQRQADYALYDDHGELRLIFPNIKPGAVTESIVLIEESQFRMPGEFTVAWSWAYGWPARKLHRVIDAPETLAARLKVTMLGQAVPEPARHQLPKNRVRMDWQKASVSALARETNRPPTSQTGPMAWLTTLADWDAFVRWYAPLVEARSALEPALAKSVDEWTQAAGTPDEVLGILFSKVAINVRYTGLEFGSSDLEPHDCTKVWESQYGDCKDKANLLRAMLRHKGIPAYLVLVNTDNAGRIEKRSPDFRQFDHAIVAVELAPDRLVFCDPTISRARPGLLSPNSADRDVLVVKKEVAFWAHTPPQPAGTLSYEFDLKLHADGELSGWMTQESSDYYGASQAEYYQEMSRERVRETASSSVQGFFRGADVVDATKDTLEKWDGVHRFKTYFVVPGGAEEKVQTLAFPQSDSMFINPGAQKQRATPYYVWPDLIRLKAKIQLPEGFSASELPRPFRVESPSLDIAAKWEIAGRECRAEIELKTKTSLVMPERFEVLCNALLSARAWLDRPLRLSAQTGAAPVEAPKSVTIEDFPMMPSGEGQLQLVEQRYPREGDRALRREALQKVQQYFPTDKSTLFSVGVHLAIMEWDAGDPSKAAEQIRAQLQKYQRDIDREEVTWAEYVLAMVLKAGGQPAEALRIFERMSADRQVPELRRAWAFYQRAALLEKDSPANAIQVIREGLVLQTEALPSQFTLLAKLLLAGGRPADLKEEIRLLITAKHPQAQAMLTRLAQVSGSLLPAEKSAERDELIRMLEEAGKTSEFEASFLDALQAAKEDAREASAGEAIRTELKRYLTEHPVPALDATAAELKKPADFTRVIAEAESKQEPEKCLRYSLELLTRFQPGEEFSTDLWHAANYADWNERSRAVPEPILPVLLDLCDRLPTNTDGYFDGKFLRAGGCERRNDWPAAQQIYEQILREPKLSAAFKVAAHGRLAATFEAQHEYARALELYRLNEPQIQLASAKDGLLRAVLLNLEMDNRKEALRLLDLLGQRTPEALRQASASRQILALVELARDHAKAEGYWNATAQWWPAWLALEKEFGTKPQGGEQIIPVIENSLTYGTELNAAAKQGRAAYFEKLRVAAHAARWEPELSMELAGLLIFHTVRYAPEQSRASRQFVVTMFSVAMPESRELRRKAQLQMAIAAVDNNQSAKAVEVIESFEKQTQQNDPISQAMARLRAVVAIRENLDLATAATVMEKSVSSSDLREDRALSVTLLADLYERLGRTAEEGKLLKDEMENPQVKAAPEQLQTITTRFERWNQRGEKGKDLAGVVARWMEKSKPAWFDFAEPKSLEDSRVANLEWALKEPHRIFTPPEVIKFQALVTSAASPTFETRQQAFLAAFDDLIDFAHTQEEARAVYDPWIEDSTAPEWIRVEAGWRALSNAYQQKRTADFEKLRSNPLVEKLGEPAKAALALFQQALAVDDSSPEALSAFCEKLLQKALTTRDVSELNRCFIRLLELGQIAIAEKLYGRLGKASFSQEVEPRAKSIQMEFLKRLNQAKRWMPAATELRQLVLAQYPPESIAEPAEIRKLHNLRNLSSLDMATALQVRLYLIKTQRFQPWDLEFWIRFTRDLPRTDENQKLTFKLIEASLRQSPGDIERAAMTSAGATIIDLDDEGQATEFSRLLQPYRDSEKHPITYSQIRLTEILQAWRSGKSINVEAELSSLRHPLLADTTKRLKLESYIQTRKLTELRQLLESTSADELLSEASVEQTFRAYEAAGMSDELELARDAARKALYHSVLDSWVTLDFSDALRAFRLAAALREPALLPAEWVKTLTTRIRHERINLMIRTEDASLRAQWPSLLSLTNQAIQDYPTFYHFYWLKATALYHLDRKPEALEPLQIYMRHSKNESEWIQAEAYLRELQPPANPR